MENQDILEEGRAQHGLGRFLFYESEKPEPQAGARQEQQNVGIPEAQMLAHGHAQGISDDGGQQDQSARYVEAERFPFLV